MRIRRALAAAVGGTVAGLLAVLMWPTHTKSRPPALSLVSMVPAGIIDDMGLEMWLVTLSLSNLDSRPPSRENYLYVKNSGRAIEAKVGNRWVKVEGALDCVLAPGESREKLFLMPAQMDGCRVCLKHTGSRLVGGQLWRMSERLPSALRFRMPHHFWRWVAFAGFPRYAPNSDWQEINMELPLPSKTAQPASINGRALLRRDEALRLALVWGHGYQSRSVAGRVALCRRELAWGGGVHASLDFK